MKIMIFNLGCIISFKILAKWRPFWDKGAHVVVVVLIWTTKLTLVLFLLFFFFFNYHYEVTGRIYTELNKTLLLAHTEVSSGSGKWHDSRILPSKMSVLLIQVCFSTSVFVCEKSPLRNLPALHYWNNTLPFLLPSEKPIAWFYLSNWCGAPTLVRTGSPQRRPLMGLYMHPPPFPESPKWRANGINGNLFFLKCQTAHKCFLEPFGTSWAYYWGRAANW